MICAGGEAEIGKGEREREKEEGILICKYHALSPSQLTFVVSLSVY